MSELVTFIPAGGLGSRLHPHTTTTPKPLLPMGAAKRKIIDFPIELSASVSKQTWVSIDYLGDQLDSYLEGIGGVTGLHDNETLGSGGSLMKHYDEISTIDSAGDILILPSDHIYEGLSLARFWQKHQEDQADITLLTVPPKPYGEFIKLTDGQPSSVEQHATDGTLSTTGIFILRNQFLMNWLAVRRNSGENPNCNIYHDIIRPSVGRYAVSHYFLDYPGYWEDAGTPLRYWSSNMRLSRGDNVVAPDARIDAKVSLDACVVLPGTVLEGNVTAKNSIISNGADNELFVTHIS